MKVTTPPTNHISKLRYYGLYYGKEGDLKILTFTTTTTNRYSHIPKRLSPLNSPKQPTYQFIELLGGVVLVSLDPREV